MSTLNRITVAARTFCVAAILGLALATGDLVAVQATVLLGALAASASAVDSSTRFPQVWVAGFEAVVTGLLIGLVLPSSSALLLLPYLVVPALVAGVSRGLTGLVTVLSCETLSLLALGFAPLHGTGQTSDFVGPVAPWLFTSLGVGLLGVWLRYFGNVAPKVDSSYEAARRLLTQLRTVARRLSSGLDTGSMAVQLLTAISDLVATSGSAVFVRTDGGILTPIGYLGAAARERFLPTDVAISACWTEMEIVSNPLSAGCAAQRTALPLRVGSRMFGVVLADFVKPPTEGQLTRLMEQLDQHSLRLDTALAFDEVRSLATLEERHRLAREIHDGVAQEIASLGYLVDEVRAGADSETQRELLTFLRAELTRIVGELRHSIFELRSEVTPSGSLGSALSDYLREVGTRSGITIHLTLDDSPTRLRAEVETELLRIAQEAITNARKHSGAENLWVDCRIAPPFARIAVIDDGSGSVETRDGSYGLKIMRERARRIDAVLEIRPGGVSQSTGVGTCVVVTVSSEPQRESEERDPSWQSTP